MRVQRAEPGAAPLGERRDGTAEPGGDEQQPDGDAAFQPEDLRPAGDMVVPRDALVPAVDLGEAAEQHQLDAHDDGQARVHHRVDVEADLPDRDRSGQQCGDARHAERGQYGARPHQRLARREHQQEPQVPPAVAPGAQVRRAAAPVRLQCGRYLDQRVPGERGAYDQLGGELHARHAESERPDALPVEAADAAVEVADLLQPEHEASDPRQDRVAQIPVQERHGTGSDAALEPVAHDHVVALAQLVDERAEVGQVVGVVRVGHDDVPPAGRLDAGHQCAAVAADRGGHHAGPVLLGDALRTVGRPVVADQDLAVDAEVVQALAGLLDAHGERLRLVETRQDDADLDRVGRHGAPSRWDAGGSPQGSRALPLAALTGTIPGPHLPHLAACPGSPRAARRLAPAG